MATDKEKNTYKETYQRGSAEDDSPKKEETTYKEVYHRGNADDSPKEKEDEEEEEDDEQVRKDQAVLAKQRKQDKQRRERQAEERRVRKSSSKKKQPTPHILKPKSSNTTKNKSSRRGGKGSKSVDGLGIAPPPPTQRKKWVSDHPRFQGFVATVRGYQDRYNMAKEDPASDLSKMKGFMADMKEKKRQGKPMFDLGFGDGMGSSNNSSKNRKNNDPFGLGNMGGNSGMNDTRFSLKSYSSSRKKRDNPFGF